MRTRGIELMIGMALVGACTGESASRADTAAAVVAGNAKPASSGSTTPWDAARARGADFRAIGQEPGWTLEIHEREKLFFVGNYGKDSLAFDIPTPMREAEGVVEYAGRDGTHTLHTVIRETPCQDTMSGDAFTHTVTIHVDKQELKGCGRRL